jgi:hypothetical protein
VGRCQAHFHHSLLLAHALTQPLGRGRIMTGSKTRTGRPEKCKCNREEKRCGVRPESRNNRANMLGVLQTGKIRVGTSHLIVWMTAAACIASCSSVATNGYFLLRSKPWGVHVSQRNRTRPLAQAGGAPGRAANCTAVATNARYCIPRLGKMHAQERGSLLDCFRDPRGAGIHGRHQSEKVRQSREHQSRP